MSNLFTDITNEFDGQDIDNNKVLSLFAYLGPLVLVPILAAKDSRFARFHANQGLVMLLVSIAIAIIEGILVRIPVLGWIIYIAYILASICIFALSIYGIVNAVTGKAIKFPFIDKINLIKY
ncbi:MAG: DUF4870 domain-containing protein [Lachnospiraceae bacterium]|nr:DUF4870 domain-containing protein [Lachnospiraceae bacterium]